MEQDTYIAALRQQREHVAGRLEFNRRVIADYEQRLRSLRDRVQIHLYDLGMLDADLRRTP